MSEHRSSEFGTAMSGLVGIVVLVAVVYTLTAARFSGSDDIGTPEQVAARISPVGTVTLAGSEQAAVAAAPAAVAVSGDEGPGAALYNKTCIACHGSGAAGAPKIGDKVAWGPRMARGLDQLLQTAVNGKGAMPPRGTCMDCSDDDLKAAIEYMLVQVGYEPETSADTGSAQAPEGMSGMGGMGGMSGMSGIGAMPGMGGMSGMGDVSAGSTDEASPADNMPGMQGEPIPQTPPSMQ